ncbi:MAG: helicase RepA family protein [Ralstonia sp.]|jgi:regulatory protein RepA|uniref:Regulatory protein RepA n=2 Tax=Ralstonia TaxID=48736 RepID=A0ABM9JIY8_9RALS|nr:MULTISPECIES: helicase RepA family protein [Ralstonia]MBA9845301.1 DNA helicase [Ralstonia pickettii]MBA9852307.1 DNA helicase [Ralstonia pickettii]MBA9878721.1 DNA helicase [Ralstonia pickettii]MBA9881954.1 DNA helicase [Ralstonia pickettii]MBA9888797.1 DNA helicase [Ralstonia pickettii]
MTALSDLKLNIRHLLMTPPPTLEHILPGLLAGTVGALIAPGSLGKTMLLMQIGCAMASGQPILGGALDGCSLSPAKVVLFLAEEPKAVIHQRLHGVSEQLQQSMVSTSRDSLHTFLARLHENLGIYPLNGRGSLVCFGVGNEEYRQLVELCKGARLVIVDPLRRFHDGDENDTAMMTAVVNRFERLAHDTGAAVLIAHHANRMSMTTGGGEYAYASRGCTALTDAIRWQANLSPVSEQLAGELGIPKAELRQFVRLDSPKTNYVGTPATVVLRKAPHSGAMTVWTPDGASKSPSAARKGRTTGAKR